MSNYKLHWLHLCKPCVLLLFWFKASMHGTVWEMLPLQWIITTPELRGRDQQQRSTCYRTYQRDAEHRQNRSDHCSCTFANQRLLHLSSERLYQRLALPSGEVNHTFYILHSMWLCTICWYPDDGVPCLAFSRWHEIKSKSPRYFCFLQLSWQTTALFISPTLVLTLYFFEPFDQRMSMPRFSVD